MLINKKLFTLCHKYLQDIIIRLIRRKISDMGHSVPNQLMPTA